MKNEKAAFKAT